MHSLTINLISRIDRSVLFRSWTLQAPSGEDENTSSIGVILTGRFYVSNVEEKRVALVNEKMMCDVQVGGLDVKTLSLIFPLLNIL